MSKEIAGDVIPLKKAFPLHGCEAAHSQIISKKICFQVFSGKSSAVLTVKTFFSFVEDVSGVTNTT